MEEEALTREEYMQRYGVDPEAALRQPQQQGEAARFARNFTVGLATTPTDFVALPEYAWAAGKAAFGDEPFLQGFQKNLMVEGAQEKIAQHLGEQVEGWKRQAVESGDQLNESDVTSLLSQYQKTREYENFTNSLKKGMPYVADQWRDMVRHTVGDTRTEAERGWVDAAEEVAGGAFLGLPRAASAVAGQAATRLGTSLPARAVVRTAEALTPFTTPYTGTNIAINAGAGIALNQGLRAAQGQSTAFTPSSEDDASIGALAGIAGAVGVGAALVAATKGRMATTLRNSSVSPGAINAPHIEAALPGEAQAGTAGIVAGPPRNPAPVESFMDTLGPFERNRIRALNNVDEVAVPRRLVAENWGEEGARAWEAVVSDNIGAAQYDGAHSFARQAMHEFDMARQAFSNEELARMDGLAQLASHKQIWDAKIANLDDQINALQQALSTATNVSSRGALTRQLNDAQTLRTRMQGEITGSAPAPELRPALQNLPYPEVQRAVDGYLTSTDPRIVRFKQALEVLADDARDLAVKSGRISRADANVLATKVPNFTPMISDPLNGAVGISRHWQSIREAAANRLFANREGATPLMAHETPRFELDLTLQDYNLAQADTRITTPLNPQTAWQMYLEKLSRSTGNMVMRNDTIHKIARDKTGNVSQLVSQGYLAPFEVNGRSWFHPSEIYTNPVLKNALEHDHNLVPRWDSGRVEFWQFGDPEMAAFLRQAPIQLNSMMKLIGTMSSTFKANTTGVLAPLFAMKNAMYDFTVGIGFRPRDRAFGPVQTGLRMMMRAGGFPEGVINNITGRLADPSGAFLLPVYAARMMGEITAHYIARAAAIDLARRGPLSVVAQAMGGPAWQRLVEKMYKVTNDSYTMQLLNRGVGHNFGLNDPAKVYGAFEAMKQQVPAAITGPWSYFRDMVTAVHMAPKRQYFAENYVDLAQRFNGRIPKEEMDKLVNDVRNMAGNVARRPGSELMRNIDVAMPYTAPIRASLLLMGRGVSSLGEASYTLPRLAMAMGGVAYSQYVMTHWDENSLRDWKTLPTWQRNRVVMVPTIKTMMAWAHGEDVPYTREAVYLFDIAPDVAPMVAGTVAGMQMMGMLPSVESVNSGLENALSVIADAVTPAMPPALQLLLAQSGMKLDPQGAEARGGNWIRTIGGFKKGPLGENTTSLGEQSTSTALVMNALLGSNGGFLARSLETFAHASKYEPGIVGPKNTPVLRQSPDFAEGLRLATTSMITQQKGRMPDAPLVWQNTEKYQIGTPTWQYVSQSKQHILSIAGMKDGPAAQRARQVQVAAGGIPAGALTDVALARIASDVYSFDRSGDLGKLKKQYTDLSNAKRGLEVNYNMPASERTSKLNDIIIKIQDNLEQQQLAIQYFEQQLGVKYGQALAPRLRGRKVDMKTLDSMMRESMGGASSPQTTPAEAE